MFGHNNSNNAKNKTHLQTTLHLRLYCQSEKTETPHRGIVKEEYLVIIMGYVFLFLHKTYVVGTR